jgi:hypothetical protein
MARRIKFFGQNIAIGTFPTSSSISAYWFVTKTGIVKAVYFGSTTALARHASNYWTFSITNLGQAGAGSTAILGAVDGNTTKTTTGQAVVANGKFTAVLHTTAANLEVTEGDTLQVTCTATGTPANTGTFGRCMIGIDATGL